jgi:hypothetical protein
MSMPRRMCLAATVAASLLAGSGPSQGAGSLPGPQCKANGPCMVPDSLEMLATSASPVLASNFGILVPANPGTAGGGYEFVCEEVFGGRVDARTKIAPDGRTYVPALDGVYASGDGCNWTRASGALAGQTVYDLALDPTAPGRLWEIGGDPRVLGLSTDGGATFTATATFPDTLRFFRVFLAPSNPRVM